MPDTPSSATIGKRTRERPTARFGSTAWNGEMTIGAIRMKSAESAPRPSSISQKRRRGDPPGALALALFEQLAEHRHERRRERRVGDERADEVRDLERDREGVDPARGAEVVARDHLADEPEHTREPGRDPEDEGRHAEPARRRLARRSRSDRSMRTRGSSRRTPGETLLWYPDRARSCGHFYEMPNIKQQKKRVRIAAEERLENLRYRSTDQDADEASRDHRRRRRRRRDRERAPRAREADRPRGRPRRAAPERRRAQEVAGREARGRRRRRLLAHAACGCVISTSARSSSSSFASREPPFSAWSRAARRMSAASSSPALKLRTCA